MSKKEDRFQKALELLKKGYWQLKGSKDNIEEDLNKAREAFKEADQLMLTERYYGLFGMDIGSIVFSIDTTIGFANNDEQRRKRAKELCDRIEHIIGKDIYGQYYSKIVNDMEAGKEYKCLLCKSSICLDEEDKQLKCSSCNVMTRIHFGGDSLLEEMFKKTEKRTVITAVKCVNCGHWNSSKEAAVDDNGGLTVWRWKCLKCGDVFNEFALGSADIRKEEVPCN